MKASMFGMIIGHSNGPLMKKYGKRIIYDLGSSIDARLSTMIRDGEWCWPYQIRPASFNSI